MMAWDSILTTLVANLGKLIPARQIDDGDHGCRITLGRYHDKLLQPGCHWFVPWVQRIQIESAVLDTLRTPDQSVTTKDGKSACVSLSIGFIISNPRLFLTKLTDGEEIIGHMLIGHVVHYFQTFTWDELASNPKPFQDILRTAISKDMNGRGVIIKWVRIADLAQARHFRLLS